MKKRGLFAAFACLTLLAPAYRAQAHPCGARLVSVSAEITLLNEQKALLLEEREKIRADGFQFSADEETHLTTASGLGIVRGHATTRQLIGWYGRRIDGLIDVIDFEVRKRMAEDVYSKVRSAVDIDPYVAREDLVKLASAIDLRSLSLEQVADYLRYAASKDSRGEIFTRLKTLFSTQEELDLILQDEAAPGKCCGSGCQSCRYSSDLRKVAHKTDYFSGKTEAPSADKPDVFWGRLFKKRPAPETLMLYQAHKALVGVMPYLSN